MMPSPRWDDPESFHDRLPSDYNAKGVFAEGPQPPSSPLTRLQAGRRSDAAADALPPNVARNVLTRVAKRAKRLRLALFSHRPKPPSTPVVSSFRLDPPPEGD